MDLKTFHTIVSFINVVPMPVLNKFSPFFKLFQYHPNYSIIKIFGLAFLPASDPVTRYKLEYRINRCIFIRYSFHYKEYQCLHFIGRVYISNHVNFDDFFF